MNIGTVAQGNGIPMPSFEMSPEEKARLNMEVDTINKQNFPEGRKPKQELGKDDFLQLLVAQLTHQDPTSPLEDTQFVAQMAQFSSLEQMTNMSAEFAKLAGVFRVSEASSMLGKTVTLNVGDTTTTGVVQAATREEKPRVMVGGRYYTMDQISAIYGN